MGDGALMPRCEGVTKAGTRCTRRWRTADPGLSRGPWWCDQHADQRLSDQFMTDLYQAITNHCTVDFKEFPADVRESMRANVRAVLAEHGRS